MKKQILALLTTCFVLTGCATTPTPRTAEKKTILDAQVNEAIAVFKARIPDVQLYFDESVGYAVFPRIVKGAFFVGAMSGRGQVFKNHELVGFSLKRGGSLGLSFGGQYFRELIFFENERALERFQSGEFAFTADATAVAASAGAAAKTNYKNGMAVFILTDVGLMADASLGGQKFTYEPVGQTEGN